VGLFFQSYQFTPLEVSDSQCPILQQPWRKDFLRLDQLYKDPTKVERWEYQPGEDTQLDELISYVHEPSILRSFLAAIRQWADKCPQRAAFVLKRAGWLDGLMGRSREWYEVDKIMKMADGVERSAKLAEIERDWPRFFRMCKEDVFCGM